MKEILKSRAQDWTRVGKTPAVNRQSAEPILLSYDGLGGSRYGSGRAGDSSVEEIRKGSTKLDL